MDCLDFEQIDSTNTYLLNNYNKYNNFTFVSAKYQTSGRGRNGRSWLSEGNNLTFSVLLKEEGLIEKYQELSIISAYTIIEVLQGYGLQAKLKWPNDVLVDDKKICGILIQAISKEKIQCLVVGIGINVNQNNFVGDYLTVPTSIALCLHEEVDVEKLKLEIYRKLEVNFNLLKEGKSFFNQIKDVDYLKGKRVYAMINNQKVEVEVIGIKENYLLEVIYQHEHFTLNSCEVSFHI